MRLPAEVRNEIYRLVLLTQLVSTNTPKANPLGKHPGQGGGGVATVEPDEVAIGTVRCALWRTYKLGYQVSLLRANRQIYREAWSMLHLDNFWTLVQMNKAGFGEEMKNCGFPVATAGDMSRHVRFPVMKVRVTFPSLEDQNQSDTFVIAAIHLRHLMRALWTAKGASEMDLTIHIQPRRTNESPDERNLLWPFLKLRNVKKITILGVSEQKYNDYLTRSITKQQGIYMTFAELRAGIKCLQTHIKAKQWRRAIKKAENHSLLMQDSRIVYGNRFVGVELGIRPNRAITRGQAAKEIIIASAMIIAEVSLHLRQYNKTVRFASRALDLITYPSFIRMPNATNPSTFITLVVPPQNSLAPVTRVVTYDNETKALLHLLRARAYISIRQAASALYDINKAREFMPDSAILVSVSHAWELTYGPIPASLAPPPPPCSTSRDAALTSAFADAINDL